MRNRNAQRQLGDSSGDRHLIHSPQTSHFKKSSPRFVRAGALRGRHHYDVGIQHQHLLRQEARSEKAGTVAYGCTLGINSSGVGSLTPLYRGSCY